jgi:hypothetical protein
LELVNELVDELVSSQVWSRRLWGPLAVTTASPIILFTVPVGHVYVVREVLAYNTSSTLLPTIRIGINSLSTAANRIFQLPLPQPGTLQRELRLPLVAGETLRAVAVDAEVSSLTINGYDLMA